MFQADEFIFSPSLKDRETAPPVASFEISGQIEGDTSREEFSVEFLATGGGFIGALRAVAQEVDESGGRIDPCCIITSISTAGTNELNVPLGEYIDIITLLPAPGPSTPPPPSDDSTASDISAEFDFFI
jgi:hypothetical protein